MFFELIGNEEATKFFLIDRLSGEVKLRTSLLQDQALAETYTVSLQPTWRLHVVRWPQVVFGDRRY